MLTIGRVGTALDTGARLTTQGDVGAFNEAVNATGRELKGKYFFFNVVLTANDPSLVADLLIATLIAIDTA